MKIGRITKGKNSLKILFSRLVKLGVSKNRAERGSSRKLSTVMFVLLRYNREFKNYFNKNFATLTG